MILHPLSSTSNEIVGFEGKFWHLEPHKRQISSFETRLLLPQHLYLLNRYISVATSHCRWQMGYFLLLPMRPKISKFSSETQKLPEIGCVRFRIRFKSNFHTLNSTFFFYIKISSSAIFSMIWCDLPVGGKSDICVCFVSKVKLSSSPPQRK